MDRADKYISSYQFCEICVSSAKSAGNLFAQLAFHAVVPEYFPQIALTPREVEVLAYVAKGLANKEIAGRLGTASGTIKMHVQNILGKLGAADRTHAVTIAFQRGILRLE